MNCWELGKKIAECYDRHQRRMTLSSSVSASGLLNTEGQATKLNPLTPAFFRITIRHLAQMRPKIVVESNWF